MNVNAVEHSKVRPMYESAIVTPLLLHVGCHATASLSSVRRMDGPPMRARKWPERAIHAGTRQRL